MNVSLDNPYGDVTIPRAKLRTTAEDGSTIIINPMALNSTYDGTASNNPYAVDQSSSESKNASQNYTVKEDRDEVGRCPACCYRCRRK